MVGKRPNSMRNLDKAIRRFGTTDDEYLRNRMIVSNTVIAQMMPEVVVKGGSALKLSYLGRPWCTVAFELGHNEIGDADNPEYVYPAEAARMLVDMGFSDPAPIPMMPLRYQIAQKLHGLSEPGSRRAHDLIDLQVIVANEQVNYGEVRGICERLYKYRRLQAWPAYVQKGENWEDLYAQQLLPEPVLQNLDEAIDWVNAFIGEIDETGE